MAPEIMPKMISHIIEFFFCWNSLKQGIVLMYSLRSEITSVTWRIILCTRVYKLMSPMAV